jgi:hypothetical protein
MAPCGKTKGWGRFWEGGRGGPPHRERVAKESLAGFPRSTWEPVKTDSFVHRLESLCHHLIAPWYAVMDPDADEVERIPG